MAFQDSVSSAHQSVSISLNSCCFNYTLFLLCFSIGLTLLLSLCLCLSTHCCSASCLIKALTRGRFVSWSASSVAAKKSSDHLNCLHLLQSICTRSRGMRK